MIPVCFSEEMYLALVLSKKAHAKVVTVDTSAALTSTGVVDYISCASIPGSNTWGPVKHDEEFFASEKVNW